MNVCNVFNNFIDGELHHTNNENTFLSLNPYNPDDVLGKFYNTNSDDVDYAVKSSVTAFNKWSKIPAPQRVEILRKSIQQVEENKEEIAEIMTKEQGKPMRESLGEITKAIAESHFMIGEGLRLYGITAPSEKENSWTQTTRVPIGPVAAITPWNFPILTPLRKIMPALVAGNTVVIKPSELTPLTGLKLVEIMNEIALPKGVLSAINGGKETGEFLTEHQSIKAITFTGSTKVGNRISNVASQRMIRMQAELGGKNPVVIWDYEQIDNALQEIIGAAFACTGQRCTAISRIIVPQSESNKIEELLVNEINQIKLGNGLDEETTMGPLINEDQISRVEQMVARAQEEGANLAVGGKRVTDTKGYFYPPTLLTNVKEDMEIAREEVFGPVISLQEVQSFDEAIALANDTKYGLSAAIYSDRLNLVGQFVDSIQSGMVHVNHGTAPESHMPFSGVKQSGLGQGSVGITTKDFFTDTKTVYIKHS